MRFISTYIIHSADPNDAGFFPPRRVPPPSACRLLLFPCKFLFISTQCFAFSTLSVFSWCVFFSLSCALISLTHILYSFFICLSRRHFKAFFIVTLIACHLFCNLKLIVDNSPIYPNQWRRKWNRKKTDCKRKHKRELPAWQFENWRQQKKTCSNFCTPFV